MNRICTIIIGTMIATPGICAEFQSVWSTGKPVTPSTSDYTSVVTCNLPGCHGSHMKIRDGRSYTGVPSILFDMTVRSSTGGNNIASCTWGGLEINGSESSHLVRQVNVFKGNLGLNNVYQKIYPGFTHYNQSSKGAYGFAVFSWGYIGEQDLTNVRAWYQCNDKEGNLVDTVKLTGNYKVENGTGIMINPTSVNIFTNDGNWSTPKLDVELGGGPTKITIQTDMKTQVNMGEQWSSVGNTHITYTSNTDYRTELRSTLTFKGVVESAGGHTITAQVLIEPK